MKRFFHHFTLRLIALFSALLLWFYIAVERNYETKLSLPLRLVNIPDHLIPTTPIPHFVTAIISGKGKEILLLHFASAELLLNGESAVIGLCRLPLNNRTVSLSVQTDVRILSIKNPVELLLPFDAKISKPIRVIPSLTLSSKRGYTLIGTPILVPETVTVIGPRRLVAEMSDLQTLPVQATGLTHDTTFSVPVRIPDLFGIEIMPARVNLHIAAGALVKHRLDNVPIRLIDAPPDSGWALNVNTLSFTIVGTQEEIDAVRPERINAYVSYTRFRIEQQTEIEPTISLLGNVEWSNLEPKTVHLVKQH